MNYNSNPRRVYGKAKITYVDSDLSMGITTETSGNGEISDPSQVYSGYFEPTIKACTMDGNSTMGGGYQMNGNDLITGWWSDVHCDGECSYVSPPYLLVTFLARPILRWEVYGDSKLNEYPVDFDIILYKDDVVVATHEIRNNDKVLYKKEFVAPYADITAIKLVIYKWNKPNAKAKILNFFDIVEEEYAGGDLKEFEVLEELAKDESTSYGIKSDSATFTIYNRERKFDKGYLKELILLDRKVQPYIGIENEDGEIEYTKFGTFYTDDWSIPQSDVWVKVKCTDKLMSLQKKIYLGYPYTEMVSLYDIATDILAKCEIAEESYTIDNGLKDVIVYNAFMQKCTAWEALESVCYAGLAVAYINRNDVLVIEQEKCNDSQITISGNSILKLEKATNKTDFCNYIEVAYTMVEKSTTQVEAYNGVITLEPNTSKTIQLDYSSIISDASIGLMPSVGIEMVSFSSSVNACLLTLNNLTNNAITTTVKISGYSLNTKTQTVVVSDENSINAWGKQEYSYASSDLVQSYDRAYDIGQVLLNKLSMGNGSIKITWRGNPNLKLQDKVTINDRFNDSESCKVVYNNYKYNGSLQQETICNNINEED